MTAALYALVWAVGSLVAIWGLGRYVRAVERARERVES